MKHSEEFERLVASKRAGVKEVTLEQYKTRAAQNATLKLIDVREDNEWEKGHAVGAEHFGRGVIERDIVDAVPDKETEIVLYCGGGYRSVLAAENLQLMGYQRVSSLIGGWRAIVADESIPKTS